MRLLITLAAIFSSAIAAADKYTIDPVHSSIVFKISHMGFSNLMGFVNGAEGSFTIDEANPEKSSVEISAKAENLVTFDKKRDEHLRGPDFFNVKQFPTISFKSKSVKKTGDKSYQVDGELSMHGVTKPLSFTFNRMNTGKDPMGTFRTGGETTFTVKRSDFNMNYMAGPGKIGDDVEMFVNVEGTKK